jgi:hypothetical protein
MLDVFTALLINVKMPVDYYATLIGNLLPTFRRVTAYIKAVQEYFLSSTTFKEEATRSPETSL